MEVADEEVQSTNLDHHDLVAVSYRELGIADKINAALRPANEQRVVK